ncbi:response regulator transcription factor [Bacillus thermotolerans]|uniref:Two-component response regulator n=1 Tax=Bacillus thermotolerans TaxID=1221996 RepID=A0A0F5HR50_BACTR|nr:response regulator transcription factor [Bacillus thermotolerans]KKB33535.1 Two-component response regulator [Bacillus thermotolerans]KKB34032.1 Two-component response regulator [Bacillus thermotolerans]KKB35796.1 Two-component response regulator [Bacillus thermotolerans]
MYTILLIEEEPALSEELCTLINDHNISCIRSGLSSETLCTVSNRCADLIVLSAVSSSSWIELCKQIKDYSSVPVVLFTEGCDEAFILQSLQAGADDFMIKSMGEGLLLAKMEAHLRRSPRSGTEELEFKGLVVNRERLEVRYHNTLLTFTQKEYALMEYFLSHPNQVITRERLLLHFWTGHHHIDTRTIDSHIRNIRAKLREVGFPATEYLRTVRGVGYRWKNDEACFVSI